MPKLFGVDIQGIIAKAMGKGFFPVQVRKVTVGDRSGTDPGGGRVLSRGPIVTARAILDSYEDKLVDGTKIKVGDRKALILAGTLPSSVVPTANDELVAESKVWVIINVKRDPASATYECQVREAS